MSMCLYLKAGPELELARLAKDGEALANLAMSGFGGGGFPFTQIDELTMARLSRKMEEQARQHGPEVAELMKAAHERLQKRMAELANHHGPEVAQMMKAATELLQRRLGGSPGVKGAAATGAQTGAAPNDSTSGGILDLHKSWHLLHFLFTGSAAEAPAPGGFLVDGGREIGEDLGYGPARLLAPAETREFAAFLAGLSPQELAKRIDVEKMDKLGIYAVGPDAEELQEEIADYFPKLKDYVEAAAARGEALLVWLM